MSSTLVYSELLSNIRQISILAELPTPSDDSTTISLSSDKKCLALTHQGKSTKLELPGDLSASYVPQQPTPGLKQISWRMPLVAQPQQARPEFTESPSAPWSASDLDSSTGFSCQACASIIVPAGTIKTWQDLPSANWAEMMDFWHCHKPDVPKVEQNGMDSGLVQRGYGAGASFRAQKGIGKVDLMTFLFAKEDCAVSQLSDVGLSTTSDIAPNCLCRICSAVLGVFDDSLTDVRLNKWSLKLLSSHEDSAPPLSHFLIPQLVSLTAALAVSKFLIHDLSPFSNAQTNIFVWLFASNLTVSFANWSQDAPTPPMKAAKLFYRTFDKKGAERLIDTADDSVEEVKLGEYDVAALLNTLEESTGRLPSTARKFGEWNVGILSRGD